MISIFPLFISRFLFAVQFRYEQSHILLTQYILFLSPQDFCQDVQFFVFLLSLLLFWFVVVVLVSKIVKPFLESCSFVFADTVPFRYLQAK